VRAALALACLLWASPASAQSKAFTVSEWSVLIGHSLDAAATQRCVGAGTCRELNPWLGRYDSPVAFTAAKSVVAVGQLWATRKLRRSHPKLATITNYAIAAAFVGIAARNQRVGR
jgi:hypothetical protein